MFLDFDLENLRFGHRQRHIPGGGNHVELAWKQHHEPARMPNTTGDATDRGIGVTVVRIVVDAQRRAVLEDYARRAFNLDREDVEWILEPANFKFLPVEGAGLNGAAVMVRHEFVVLVAATDPRTFVWKCIGPWPVAGRDQVRRAAVERDMEFGIGKARALNYRLKITG